MSPLYAIILIVYVQGASSLDVNVTRIDVVSTPQLSAKACDKAGQLLVGAIDSETDSRVKYTWQDFKCVSLEGK